MILLQKLKALEKQIVFLRWATGESFGKIQYVGNDFIEFISIDNDHKYSETILLRPSLILEVTYGGTNIGKLVAEISHNLIAPEN
ncbi:MAG: hypothetical protein AB1782_17825 [Cyanobacteriota bacterium]